MSSESIDLLWNKSVDELKSLIQEEENHNETKLVSINDAFHHFAKLYIRYSIVLSNLGKCFDYCVQPQKRLDLKSSIEHVILRVINLRHLVVKWAPPNSDVISKDGTQPPFPWEYADLSRDLKDLHIPPSQLEIKTPSFFRDDTLRETQKRDAFVSSISEAKFGTALRPMERKKWLVEPHTNAEPSEKTNAEPSEKTNAVSVEKSRRHEAASEDKHGHAATKIQTNVRGHISRKQSQVERGCIREFVGMSNEKMNAESIQLQKNLEDVTRKRKEEQSYCQDSYDQDLVQLRDVVRDEEGFRMQVELREERIQWVTEHVVNKNSLPESFEEFYSKNASAEEKRDEGKQSDKSTDNDKKQKDKKSAETDEVERPSLSIPQELLDPLKEIVNIYDDRWRLRNVGPDRVKSQYHDAEMAKNLIVRDQVKSELIKGVDEKLLSNILKIKAIQEAGEKKPKSRKEGKGQSKKGKGKKAGGGKKEKLLPGAKLPGLKDMKVEDMLSTLIEHGLVGKPAKHTVHDFIGGFQAETPTFPRPKDEERWVPENPSAFQLRRAIMDYCVLSLGTESIKTSIQDHENIRSLLFYGPEGSGKTLMAQAIASETNSLFINLSSKTIGNAFGGKEGATKLVHMIFSVAKERSYAPVIIYFDDCHEFFMGKSKRGAESNGGPDMQRFQKDFLIYKNQALKKEDRVLVVGCTNAPEKCDMKVLKWKGASGKPEKQGFFERFLYFPKASHSDRALIWKDLVHKHISQLKRKLVAPNLDWGALATLSNDISAGEICSIIEDVLNADRMNRLISEPLSEHEFSRYLSDQKGSQSERFLAFTRQITDLDSRWKTLNGGKQGGDKKKKK